MLVLLQGLIPKKLDDDDGGRENEDDFDFDVDDDDDDNNDSADERADGVEGAENNYLRPDNLL